MYGRAGFTLLRHRILLALPWPTRYRLNREAGTAGAWKKLPLYDSLIAHDQTIGQ